MRCKCPFTKKKCAFRDYATKVCQVLDDTDFGNKNDCSFRKTNKELRYDLNHYPNPDKAETNVMIKFLRSGDG